MKREIRALNIDKDLNIEAYNFRGIMQKFPNHFHDCYVIGFIEEGKRKLTCKNKEYIINPGEIIIFNPFDNHQCENSSREFKEVCDYLEENYSESISLDNLSKLSGLSKYYFLRCFTKKKGITPYSYLEAIRIDKAKKLLEKGVMPLDVSLQTGFSDQSHFCKFFKRFIGLTPMQYYKIHMESKRGV